VFSAYAKSVYGMGVKRVNAREDRIDHLGQQSRCLWTTRAGGKTGRYARFIWAYAKANLAMEMEYRASFIVRAFGMILNDLM
jgi:hypothetical protein